MKLKSWAQKKPLQIIFQDLIKFKVFNMEKWIKSQIRSVFFIGILMQVLLQPFDKKVEFTKTRPIRPTMCPRDDGMIE